MMRERERERNTSSLLSSFKHEKIIKFGKLEATGETGEEENFCGRERGGKEETTREKFQRESLGRKNRREIRDKETDTDNEKTSTVKKGTETRR